MTQAHSTVPCRPVAAMAWTTGPMLWREGFSIWPRCWAITAPRSGAWAAAGKASAMSARAMKMKRMKSSRPGKGGGGRRPVSGQ
ncbi:hypothetical protein [Paracoccus mutanolyticus]|uniref:hypothetical protein n=1 Tax=Paracoccus mutanolyticus TaxID=1499308 RepID=UPI001CB8BEA9|nr:hypothetical protein [Paracoccus mutanolyticus]